MGWHCKRQSVIYECRFMDFEDGSALARLAERILEMEQCSSKNTKIHLAVDALGMPIRAVVTDGPRAECKEAIPLVQNFAVQSFISRPWL